MLSNKGLDDRSDIFHLNGTGKTSSFDGFWGKYLRLKTVLKMLNIFRVYSLYSGPNSSHEHITIIYQRVYLLTFNCLQFED